VGHPSTLTHERKQSSESSDRQKMPENRIGKLCSRRKAGHEDRQKTVRRPSETVRSSKYCEQISLFSDGSDDKTVRTDDTSDDTHIRESRIGKPDSRGSDGSDDSDDCFTVGSENEIFEMARKFAARVQSGPPRLEAESSPPEFIVSARARRATAAAALGLVAKWSRTHGYISIHDSTSGEWHDLATKDAPAWARWEAAARKTLWHQGNKRAFLLTREQMEEVWHHERPPVEEEGIIEECELPDD
jgi:hypothetical protein